MHSPYTTEVYESRKMELVIKDVFSCKDDDKTYFDWRDSPPTTLTPQELLPSDPSAHENLSTDSAVGHRVRPAVSGENLPSENIESANAALPHSEDALQSLPAPAKEVYKCDVCQYKTNVSSNFKVHYRKHTGEKPYKCSYCSYSTPSQSYLPVHISTHTGEKPFGCPYCSKKARTNKEIRSHIYSKHPTELCDSNFVLQFPSK